ncbi:uncharacterized protein LOC111309054 isoform X2 [Durio zibethinus]|uniref:Uncharacterized protein LOC111309054 isoform X2 n=1 Tax=Durio zibethinus TaxID=66656 RepID=A0A6P6AFG1_DURZI|nr:uncharacterized protein LOC111309054 isoform X2 [Durio zibethinus]
MQVCKPSRLLDGGHSITGYHRLIVSFISSGYILYSVWLEVVLSAVEIWVSMAGKKRSFHSIGTANNVFTMLWNDKKLKDTASAMPMERKKMRKALEKERRFHALRDKDLHPKQKSITPLSTCSGRPLPEFHYRVFNDLCLADASVREAAVEKLVEELEEIQKVYERLENKDLLDQDGFKVDAEKDDGLKNCAPSLRYAVHRLIKGVSSPREEERDRLLGQLFAYGALARSDRLIKEWNCDNNTPHVKEFISALISLSSKKLYLKEGAVSVILEMVEKLPVKALLNHCLEAPGVIEWFEEASDLGNPDALLLALRIRERTSIDSAVLDKLLPNPFSPSNLFSANYLYSLTNCFKKSTFCGPRVHGVWSVVTDILLPDSNFQAEDAASVLNFSKKHKKGRKSSSFEEETAKNVQCFCEVVVEGSLLLSSHDCKNLALDILLLLLPRLPVSLTPIILSNKLVQCLMDILSSKNSWLYKVAQDFLNKLLDWVENDNVRRVAVIVALQKHSNGKFDCITKTKTVKNLMEEFETEAECMLFVQNMMNMFLDEGHASDGFSDETSEIGSVEDKNSARMLGNSDLLKSWIIESLPTVLKYLKKDPVAKFRVQKEILKFLAVQGLFFPSLGNEVTSFELQEKFRWPKAATSSALYRMCIEQLQSLLANTEKVEEHALEINDLGCYFMQIFSTLHNIPSIVLFQTLNNEDEKAIIKLKEMESRLYKEGVNLGFSSDGNKLHALRYLVILLLLEVLLRPGEYSEAASELVICCEKALAASGIRISSGEDKLDSDSITELMDVLVDTLLSLLSQSSASMQSVIEKVFRYFCVDVTDDGLFHMLQIIKKELKPARRPDSDGKDNDDDDDDLFYIEEDESIDDAETEETSDNDEQADDSEEVAGGEDLAIELPEDSDGDMDDDAMFRMDTHLAHIFKEKERMAGSETVQSQLVRFKLRVLSLLEIYLHEHRGKPQVLSVYSNLALAFVNPHTTECSEQLRQRIWGILQKKILKEKKLPEYEAMQLSTLESLLERNLELASKPFKLKKSASFLSKKKLSASSNRRKMHVSLAQDSTYWILKIIAFRNFSDVVLQRVFDILWAALVGYFDKKSSQLKSGFLKEIFRRHPRIGHKLLGLLLEKCGSAKLEFRRVEGLDLVIEVLKSPAPMKYGETRKGAAKRMLKSHLWSLSRLIKEVVRRMPEKQARRADVRKHCQRIFQMISRLGLSKSFLQCLGPDHGCESQLGDLFLRL